MPTAAMLTDLYIPPGYQLRISMDDLRNMYNAFPATEERAKSAPVGEAYRARDFRGWSCDRTDLADNARVRIC